MGMFGENSPMGQNGIVGGLMGGMGMNMSQIPFIGGMFPNPAEAQMQQALAGAAQSYAGAMPQFNQAYQNLLGNVLGIYSPAQNALQQIYGGGGMPQGGGMGPGGGRPMSSDLNTGLTNVQRAPGGQGGGAQQNPFALGIGGPPGSHTTFGSPGGGGLMGGLMGGTGMGIGKIGGLLGGLGGGALGGLGGLGGMGGGMLGGLGGGGGAGGLLGGLPGLGGGGGGGLLGGLPFLGGGGGHGGGGGGMLGLGFLGL